VDDKILEEFEEEYSRNMEKLWKYFIETNLDIGGEDIPTIIITGSKGVYSYRLEINNLLKDIKTGQVGEG